MERTEIANQASVLDNLLVSFRRSLLARGVSKHTLSAYLSTGKRFSAYLKTQGMPTDPAFITREHVETFVYWLRSTPLQATGEPPAPDSLKLWYRALSVLFNWLVEVGEIHASPMDKMKPPRGTSTRRPVLTDEQVKRVLRACEGADFYSRRDLALLRLFIDTGLRLSEMADIHLSDIDWDRQAVTIRHGKGDKQRVVYFGRKAAKALDQYVYLRGGRREHKDVAAPHLWLGMRGPFRQTGIARMLSKRAEEAGIGHVHPHLFRHFFIHSALMGGMQLGDLQRITGHKKLEVLLSYAEGAADERARHSHLIYGPGDRL